MFRFLLLSSIFWVGCYGFQVRIINGTDAEQSEFPYAASVRLDGRIDCGSTILNSRFVLTAAHCICYQPIDPARISFQYGYTTLSGNNSRVVQALNFTCPENQNFPSWDIAVVQLAEPLPQDGSWEAVTLTEEFNATIEHPGVVIGWGIIDAATGALPDTLQKLDVTIYTDDYCSKFAKPGEHLCVGSKYGSGCPIDSGSALIINGVQAGVLSFGPLGCVANADGQTPNGYTRVANYIDFISSVTSDIKLQKIVY